MTFWSRLYSGQNNKQITQYDRIGAPRNVSEDVTPAHSSDAEVQSERSDEEEDAHLTQQPAFTPSAVPVAAPYTPAPATFVFFRSYDGPAGLRGSIVREFYPMLG